jgi:hypothetical protein
MSQMMVIRRRGEAFARTYSREQSVGLCKSNWQMLDDLQMPRPYLASLLMEKSKDE